MAASAPRAFSLSELPLDELKAAVASLGPTDITGVDFFLQRSTNAWVKFEAEVRNAASNALARLRSAGASELLRLCEHEEQTRCHAFQGAMMGEVGPDVYKAAVRSILEKLLGKLETYAPEVSLYQSAAQCLSEYMSALNHHCDICSDIGTFSAPLPSASGGAQHPPGSLPAIPENPLAGGGNQPGQDKASLYGADVSYRTGTESESNIDYSELGSEDGETLSVHSENTDHSGRFKPAAVLLGADGSHSGATSQPLQPPHHAEHQPINPLLAGSSIIPSGSTIVPVPVPVGMMVGGAITDEMRRERRRESNKKASVKYRAKKTGSLQQALHENSTARQQISALSSQNAVLSAENQLLKQQVAFLQSMLKEKGDAAAAAAAAIASAGAGAAAAASVPQQQQQHQHVPQQAPPPPSSMPPMPLAMPPLAEPPTDELAAPLPLSLLHGRSGDDLPSLAAGGGSSGGGSGDASASFGYGGGSMESGAHGAEAGGGGAHPPRRSSKEEMDEAMLMSIDSIAMCDILAL